MTPTTATEQRLELAQLLLQVMENPTEYRIIVNTKLPNLNEPREDNSKIYFMIDKSDGGGDSVRDEATGEIKEVEPATIYDDWHVSDSAGNGAVFPKAADVLDFFDRLNVVTNTDIRLEIF